MRRFLAKHRKEMLGILLGWIAATCAKASGFAGEAPEGTVVFVLVYGGYTIGRWMGNEK